MSESQRKAFFAVTLAALLGLFLLQPAVASSSNDLPAVSIAISPR